MKIEIIESVDDYGHYFEFGTIRLTVDEAIELHSLLGAALRRNDLLALAAKHVRAALVGKVEATIDEALRGFVTVGERAK